MYVKKSPNTSSSSSLIFQTLDSTRDQTTKASASSIQHKSNPQQQRSGLFDRFLKNYSSTTQTTTMTASVLDEPEISFVSSNQSLISNPTSPTTKSTTTTSLTSNNLTIQQQKRDLSAQFQHLSPLEPGGQQQRRTFSFSTSSSSLLTTTNTTTNTSSTIEFDDSTINSSRNRFINKVLHKLTLY